MQRTNTSASTNKKRCQFLLEVFWFIWSKSQHFKYFWVFWGQSLSPRGIASQSNRNNAGQQPALMSDSLSFWTSFLGTCLILFLGISRESWGDKEGRSPQTTEAKAENMRRIQTYWDTHHPFRVVCVHHAHVGSVTYCSYFCFQLPYLYHGSQVRICFWKHFTANNEILFIDLGNKQGWINVDEKEIPINLPPLFIIIIIIIAINVGFDTTQKIWRSTDI